MHQESRQDSMRLFHLLFEHFFSEEDLIGAVAFGKRGKVPDGKKILDRRTVDGIIGKSFNISIYLFRTYCCIEFNCVRTIWE